jgi:hypothetical protein
MFEGTAEHEVLAVTVNTYSVGILCYSYIISRHWPFAASFQAMLCSCKIIVPVHQKKCHGSSDPLSLYFELAIGARLLSRSHPKEG